MRKYTHLKIKEREKIHYLFYVEKKTQKEIAKNLGRNASTISREIKRNKTMIGTIHNNDPTAKKERKNWQYLPEKAQKKYLLRRKESKQKISLKSIQLYEYVIKNLKEGLSPELISGRAKLEKIGKISYECIYQFIYSQEGRTLNLTKCLIRAHKKRHKRKNKKTKRYLIPNRKSIEDRPKAVENRKEFGHWESDSVVGVGKQSALNTNRERKTRYMMIEKIVRKTAQNTKDAMIKRFQNLPKEARKTNTADNGSEFTKHEEVTKKVEMEIYFANPYHSWERGTNENGNGLIRRFLPKKTDFDKISDEEIQQIENWINNRPMKCLGSKTPYEAFIYELSRLDYTFPNNCT